MDGRRYSYTPNRQDPRPARFFGIPNVFYLAQSKSLLYSGAMRTAGTKILTVAAIIALPLVCFGQSTLSFPRVMQPQEFSTTGFALVNPGATNAAVTYTLYGAGGTPLSTATQTITARGQLAKLASELFP